MIVYTPIPPLHRYLDRLYKIRLTYISMLCLMIKFLDFFDFLKNMYIMFDIRG